LNTGGIIAGRSAQTLEPLGFDERVIEKLRENWSGPGASSFVIVTESHQMKTPENLMLSGDGQPEILANLTVTAMRLVHSGHVGIGPMFVVRPALFNVGLSGLHQSGWPRGPVFGRRFLLTPALLMPINRTFGQLQMLERRQEVPAPGNLSLAIRYFSASFERRSASDSVVDLVTSLEAVLGTNMEISFRLATRVAQLLGSNDEERVDLFRATKLWYDLRSTVVHGGEVKAKHQPLLADPEPLREIVRRLLRGFLQLTSIDQSPYSKRFFAQDLDAFLLSDQHRGRLRSAMGLEGSSERDAG
jgi:hypothetical protein